MSKHEPYYSAKAFIGFDVHKRSIFACALIQETGELREKSFSGNGYEEVSSWIKSFADSASAVYEAGPFGFSLARFLNSQGIRCVVTHSNTLWASNPRRNKTDKEDARELARILSVGYVKPIYIPTEGEEARRSLCKERMHQVQAKGDIQRRILSFLDRHGMGESVDFSKWCEPYVDWLDSISFVSQEDTVLLSSLLSMREEIIRSLKGIDSQIEVIVSTNEDMQLLGRVYGIGNVTAFTIAAEAINLHRFKSSKAYASYFGLVPKARDSGGRRGKAPNHVQTATRTCLLAAAATVLRDPYKVLSPSGNADVDKANLLIFEKARSLLDRSKHKRIRQAALARYIGEVCWELVVLK